MDIKILNSKESKTVLNSLAEQYGITNISISYSFIRKKDKLFIISNDFRNVNIKLNNAGLYFARITEEGIRLSIEGSMIIGRWATKNVVELNRGDIKVWLKGEKVETTLDFTGFVVIKNKDNFFGCGKVKDGKIVNFVPRERRIYNLS